MLVSVEHYCLTIKHILTLDETAQMIYIGLLSVKNTIYLFSNNVVATIFFHGSGKEIYLKPSTMLVHSDTLLSKVTCISLTWQPDTYGALTNNLPSMIDLFCRAFLSRQV